MVTDGPGRALWRIRIGPHPAWPVLAVLIPLHLGAGACVWVTSLPVWAQLAATAAAGYSLFASAGACLRRAGRELLLTADARWFVVEKCGLTRPVTPVSCLFVHEALGLVTIRDEQGAYRPFFLSSFNTDADTRRRLRVRLRFPNG